MLRSLTSQLGASLTSVQRFLDRPIGLGRRARGADAPRDTRRKPSEDDRKRVRLMSRDLCALLDRHPESRRMMRHLHRVERRLLSGGMPAVEALSGRVLSLALEQMEKLVWDWSPVGLAELRSRIAVLLKTRPVEPAGDSSHQSLNAGLRGADDEISAFDAEQRADVSEVGHEMFEEMERSWTGRVPDDPAAPTAASPAPRRPGT